MNSTISRTAVEDAIDNAGIDTDEEISIRDDYSGRGMYGSTCWGLVGTVADITRVIFHLGHQAGIDDADGDGALFPDIDSMLTRLSMDTMGRDTIVYFPGWTLED